MLIKNLNTSMGYKKVKCGGIFFIMREEAAANKGKKSIIE